MVEVPPAPIAIPARTSGPQEPEIKPPPKREGQRFPKPPGPPRSPYEILGVPPGATKEEIRKAYLEQAKRVHTDIDPSGKEKFQQINNAYSQLVGKEARQQRIRAQEQYQQKRSMEKPGYSPPQRRMYEQVFKDRTVRKQNARRILEQIAHRYKSQASRPPTQPEVQPQPEEPVLVQPVAPLAPEAQPEAPPSVAEPAAPTNPSPEAQPTSEREQIDKILQEASSLLLELKDARIVLTALARQAADTPLGHEFRDRVLDIIQEIDASKLPADQRQAFDALKQKMIEIRPLPQPEIPTQETQLYKLLQRRPANEQTTFLMQALEHGSSIPGVVDYTLKHPELKSVALALQKELFGSQAIPQSAQELLKAAGINETKENIKAMEGILHPKDKLTLRKLGNSLFIALAIMMLSSQMLAPMMQESEGQRAH